MSFIPQIVCPCSSVIVKSMGDDSLKIRSKVIIIKGNQAFAVCKSCNQEVQIPISLDFRGLNPPLIITK